ncbi:MAG: phage portal protein [Candidatus Xenobia bacterium]
MKLANRIAAAAGQIAANVVNTAYHAGAMFKSVWDQSVTGALAGFKAGGPFGKAWIKRNLTQWLAAYAEVPYLKVVYRHAQDVAKVEWHLYRRDPDNPKLRTEVHDHPFLDLLRVPNPWFSWRRVRYLNQIYTHSCGEWFLWIQREQPFGPPIALWPIPPHWVAAIPQWRQTKAGVAYFDVMYRFTFAGGEMFEMPFTEIIWHQEPNPLNPYWRGLGTVQGVDDEVSQLEFMAKWNNSYFRNSAVPGVIVSMQGAREDQMDRLEAWWLKKHAGFARAFIPAFVNEKTSVQVVSKNHQEMDYVNSKKDLRDTVYQNFTTPPEIMGVMENSNRASIDSAMYFHTLQNVVPRLQDEREAYNNYLVPLYDDPLLYYDYDNPVRESSEFILRRADEGLTRGALTVDEWRVDNGYAPLGPERGGDERYVPQNVAVILPDGSMAVGPNQSQQGQGTNAPASVTGPKPDQGKSLITPCPMCRAQGDCRCPERVRLSQTNGKVVLVP